MATGRKTGGRSKGTPNKKTAAKNWKLSESLAKSDIDVGTEIAKSIKAGDVDMVKALSTLLPYLSPRLAPVEVSEDPTPPVDDDLTNVPTENLLAFTRKKPD